MTKLVSTRVLRQRWRLRAVPVAKHGHRREMGGRIQLIGDAAHAMLPNAGQGACMAFEDTYVLARWLATEDEPAEAFRQFRRIRIPRVHAVQLLSLTNAKFKHMRDAREQKMLITSGGRKLGVVITSVKKK